jgi:hypothetical protein
MTNLTPYSGKFVGRKIDSGKLSLDLKYYVENSQLKGDNQIVVERIKLGDRVESPTAVSLPLNLAIALLEDADGIIDIGLPVKGDLENPEFSYGPLIWKAFVNVRKKIASAPFRALGALFGGSSENLDAVAFEPGESAIPPPEIEKLHQLAEGLKKRPNLKLVVQGAFSREKDGLAFKALSARRALARQMGMELAEGEDPGPVDYGASGVMEALSVLLSERSGLSGEEAPQTVEDSTESEETESPAAPASGASKADTRALSESMYQKLVESEPLDEAGLKHLAEERSRQIMAELVEAGGLDPERLTAKEVLPLAPQQPVQAKLDLTAM